MTTKQSAGGTARAAKLTPAERSKIAKNAARARWKPELAGIMPEASSQGVLQIGEIGIDCYVLKDQRRLIHKRAMARALGLKSEGGNAFIKTLSGKTLGSRIPANVREKIENHIVFKPLSGDPAHGYEAAVLIDLCDALIDARDQLLPSQKFLARQAEILIRSAAKVGIVALIDEATGFIADKRQDEYRHIWQECIREEARKWENAEFPDDLFEVFYNVYGLKRLNPDSTKHPKFFSKLIRKYIYQPLLNSNGAILEQLEEKNPVVYANGGRRYKLFQFLSDEIGLPAVKAQIWQVVGIARGAKSKAQLETRFYESFPEARPNRPAAIKDLFDA
ncbi:P63C domain-containing protein [Roseovarius lutimaris]|uniref:P63C domain-containing protein n=1 Tax=Roseovarius lutimaris TaxID=1005928 RepID=A0A1I5H719_9RHOB|nr:P63C domain-containing protein [Roseovarius lutimaris]SFO43890.1 P63C domain-containing protein [Roseovarius lutimaris]